MTTQTPPSGEASPRMLPNGSVTAPNGTFPNLTAAARHHFICRTDARRKLADPDSGWTRTLRVKDRAKDEAGQLEIMLAVIDRSAELLRRLADR